jgi:hypothetical protein
LYESVGLVSTYRILQDIDKEFAKETRMMGCPYCGGPLHRASYTRKPRGGPAGLPEELSVRFSLCCGREGCRSRVLPKSVLFDGRRVYWRVVILVVIALREQRPYGVTMDRLKAALGVDAKTVRRWQGWYRARLSPSGEWKGLGSRIPFGLEPGKEVGMLISVFLAENETESGMARLLRFLAEYEHLDPGVSGFTQKMGSSKTIKRPV